VPYGIGTFGSRATAIGGTALYFALQELREKVKKFGAMMLESDDVAFANGRVTCNKTGQSKSFAEIAGATYRAMKLPPNTEPGLQSTHFWEPPNFTFGFGAHIVITDIDKDTGQVKIRRYVAVDPERGLVFAFGFFDHSAGDTRNFETPDGRKVSAGPQQPWTWQIVELFEIRKGQLHQIQAIMERSPYGMNAGWSSWEDGLSDRGRDVAKQ